MNHSLTVYLMGPDGQFRSALGHDLGPERSAQLIKRVMARGLEAPPGIAQRSVMSRINPFAVQRVLWWHHRFGGGRSQDSMLYALHELAYHSAQPFRIGAAVRPQFLDLAAQSGLADGRSGRTAYASAELFESVTRRYGKPAWGLETITINDQPVRTVEQVIWQSPWVRLVRFARNVGDLKRAKKPVAAPSVLIVAPLSGHYATLLRGTVETFLQDHDVYVTDWVNARQVPMLEGRFDFHDYIDHVRTMLAQIGPRAHVVGVCQPGPPVLAAAALMAEDERSEPPGLHDLHGLADRRAPVADGDQPAGRGKALRLVPVEHDPHRALALSGLRPAGLSGLRAALQLHVDERGSATRTPTGSYFQRPGRRATATGSRSTRNSTTNICRCWT